MSKNKFARNQLTKHGWTEGSGLGKDETGIKDAIKVKLKHDTAGVGHNKGDEFTFQWWDHVFNKAASSISIKSDSDGVAVEKVTENGPISNKKAKTYDNKAMLYGQFVKGATLTNGNEDHLKEGVESSDDEESDKIELNRLMDDKMLEICGGMTAHKAARHGHKLSAKMTRVMEQEKLELELLKKMRESKTKGRKRTNSETHTEKTSRSDDNSVKRKKKKEAKFNEDSVGQFFANFENQDDSSKKSKKRKKKQKGNENDEDIDLEQNIESSKDRKKREINKDETLLIDGYHKAVSESSDFEVKDDNVVKTKTKKSKKKKKNKDKTEHVDEEVVESCSKKNKKKDR